MESADLLARMRALGGVWDAKRAHQLVLDIDKDQSQRTTERLLDAMAELPKALELSDLIDEDLRPLKTAVMHQLADDAKRKRQPSWVLQSSRLGADLVVSVNDGRLARQWVFVPGNANASSARALLEGLELLVDDKPALLWPQGEALSLSRQLVAQQGSHELVLTANRSVHFALPAYHSPKAETGAGLLSRNQGPERSEQARALGLSHLDRLEAESIHIMREVVAQADNSVMLYSVGKDSSVMLHLARKAFYPSPPPFPLMHVDTAGNFRPCTTFAITWQRKAVWTSSCISTPKVSLRTSTPLITAAPFIPT